MLEAADRGTLEIDKLNESEWSDCVAQFDDATVHQTWSMGRFTTGERNLSHLALRRNGEIVAAAQVGLRKLPAGSGGVATVYYGPLWRRSGRAADPGIFDGVIRALKEEYAEKRGLFLRVWPSAFGTLDPGVDRTLSDVLAAHGLQINRSVTPYRTMLVDLGPSIDEIRKNLDKKWRNQLANAERGDLTIVEGTDDAMLATFMTMLGETVSRKKFSSNADYARYPRLQHDLPAPLKMKIVLCQSEGQPVAGGVFSAIGSVGAYLLGATANAGLRVNGSNRIHWTVINWLKERGCRWYDLGGIDPEGNPGVFHFKKGLAGKSGRDVAHVGQFSLATRASSRLLQAWMTDRITLQQSIGRRLGQFVPTWSKRRGAVNDR